MNNIQDKLDSLFLLIFAFLLSVLSLFFNLEKVAESGKKTNIYKITRIGDILFSMVFFFLGCLADHQIYKSMTSPFREYQISERLWPVFFTILIFTFSIMLFVDNIKYHKSFKNLPKAESIDDIGK